MYGTSVGGRRTTLGGVSFPLYHVGLETYTQITRLGVEYTFTQYGYIASSILSVFK